MAQISLHVKSRAEIQVPMIELAQNSATNTKT